MKLKCDCEILYQDDQTIQWQCNYLNKIQHVSCDKCVCKGGKLDPRTGKEYKEEHCKTCKWFEKFSEKFKKDSCQYFIDRYPDQNLLGSRNRMYVDDLYGNCICTKFQAHDPAKEETDNLVYWDGEEYSCGFEVGINFGCVHWEEK